MNWQMILVGLVLLSTLLCCQVTADDTSLSAPGIGYIEVRSDIEGARVYFDTLYIGYVSGGKLTVPVDTTVKPAWSNVRMEYTGYVPYAGPYVQAEAGKTIAYRIDLSRTSYDPTGIVRFASVPSGAEFFLDGKSVGATPDSGVLIAYTVPRGLYTVTARRAGDQSIEDQLYVDDNALTNYEVKMVPSPLGDLQVTSSPEGGEIYVDNHVRGLTPLLLSAVPVGEHTIQVRKDGYQDWIANVSVIGGSQGSVEAILVSQPAPEQQLPVDTTEPARQ